jgi:hypothetical protein
MKQGTEYLTGGIAGLLAIIQPEFAPFILIGFGLFFIFLKLE